jgi:glycosyltransferase involved in cell wall biosynthesis
MQPNLSHELNNALKGLSAYWNDGGKLKIRRLIEKNVPYCYSMDNPIGDRSHAADLSLLKSIPFEYVSTDHDLALQLQRGVGVWSTRIAGGEGSALAEGFAAGLPVMAVDTPVNRNWAERVGKNPILYPVHSAAAVTEALHALEAQYCSANSTFNLSPCSASPAEDVLVAQQIGFVLDRLLELYCD